MNELNKTIEKLLLDRGVDIVRFVDISKLLPEETRGFKSAIILCKAISKEFILAQLNGEETEQDEFIENELEVDAIADWLSGYLASEGYRAFSQSEEGVLKDGHFIEEDHITSFPNKMLGLMAGIGFIGKNNLLINEEYGCAFSICSVLTFAPVETKNYPILPSMCGECDICKEVCPKGAILGNEWSENTGRKGVIDIFKCASSSKCIVHCPFTLSYAES
jgi:epoxyqueuosine reductase QueG